MNSKNIPLGFAVFVVLVALLCLLLPMFFLCYEHTQETPRDDKARDLFLEKPIEGDEALNLIDRHEDCPSQKEASPIPDANDAAA